MMWWLMAGAMISINLVARKPSAQPAAETPRRRRQPQQSSGILSPGWALTALVATIGAFVLFVTIDLDRFRAGLLGSGLGEVSGAAGSLDTARRAQELSPREEYYYQVEAFALRIQAERRYNQGDVEAARQLALQAYSVYQKYQRINPLAYETRFGAARNLVELIQYGSPEFFDDMGDRYADLAAQFPGEVKVQGIASNALLAAGRVDDALRIANWAIELESTTIPVPGAYIARGRAQLNMGMEDQAAADFAHVIETAEGELVAIAHDELAKVLEMQGRPDEAEEHRRLAEDVRSGAA
jgi:tetratricopeptide (TPR) repeat protein